ncbi:hypothetical protein [Cryobacterium sp. AP23]
MLAFGTGARLLVALHALFVLVATVDVSANRRPRRSTIWSG